MPVRWVGAVPCSPDRRQGTAGVAPYGDLP